MPFRSFLSFPLFLATTALSGCLLYSPYVSPVVQPMEKGEVELEAGVGGMPRFIAEADQELAVEGGIRYSPLSGLMLGGRLWSSTESWESDPAIDGFGFDATYLLSPPDHTDAFRFAPSIHAQWGSQTIYIEPTTGHPGFREYDTVETAGSGFGGGVNLWTPMVGPVQPFAALHGRSYTFDTEGESELSFTTVTLHGGVGYELTEHLNLGVEAVGIYEIPENESMREDEGDRLRFTPMMRVAWRF